MPVVYDPHTKQIVYKSPSEAVIKNKVNELIKQFVKYAKEHGLAADNIYFQRILLPRIILRVDQRESYFLIFHKQTQINEIKQAALMVYWILKFKPFMVITKDPILAHKHSRINEGFAAFYLYSALKQYAIEKGCAVSDISERLIDELMYAFTYWDLSKESMILIAETIGEAYFGVKTQGITYDECDH